MAVIIDKVMIMVIGRGSFHSHNHLHGYYHSNYDIVVILIGKVMVMVMCHGHFHNTCPME